MARDYANQPPRQKKRRGMRIILTSVMITVVIVIFALTYYTKYHKVTHNKRQIPKTVKIKAIHPVKSKSTRIFPAPKSEFDFYTILPKMQVPISNSTETTIRIPSPQDTKGHFMLQVASLQNLKDAQRLKSKLFSLGYMTSIEPFQSKDGIAWNRVMIGPYTAIDDAQKAEAALHQQHIDSILLKSK